MRPPSIAGNPDKDLKTGRERTRNAHRNRLNEKKSLRLVVFSFFFFVGGQVRMSGKDRRIKRHETTSTALAEIDLRAKRKDKHMPKMFLVFIQSRVKKKKRSR